MTGSESTTIARAGSTANTKPLARSAAYLVHASTRRLTERPVANCFARYRQLTEVERAAKLLRADLLVELIDVHGLRAIDIARRTGERPSNLSEMYCVARTFPPESRPAGAVYNHLLLATRAMRRFPRLALSPVEALAEIRRRGLTQHRDATRHFDRLSREARSTPMAIMRTIQAAPAAAVGREDLLFRAHHDEIQAVLPRFDDGSIQLLSLDPPYVYERSGDTYSSRSSRNVECDAGDNPVAAVQLVIDVLRDGLAKLTAGGVLLLWQPWQNLLRPIAEAAATYGWTIAGPVIWDKGRPQPGRFDAPYSVQGEFLWVFSRAGDRLVNHDVGSREVILRYPPVCMTSGVAGALHAFQKPVELNAHLVRKHSQPGDLIVDACGCTASMSVAAMRCGRRWVYVESNATNFEIGRRRISDETATRPPQPRFRCPSEIEGNAIEVHRTCIAG